MKSIDQIESLLRQTPTPCVVAGLHQEQLKQRLLKQAQTAQARREPMKISVFSRMSLLVKLAAALLVAAILIGAGWAAEKIYKIVTEQSVVISHVTPSGTTEFGSSGPNPAEHEKRANEKIKQLVDQKKYKFVRTIHHPDGNESNVYYFDWYDGSCRNHIKWKSGPPRLEEVSSWDEYKQKSEEYSGQRQKEVEEAIASGKGRLINILVTEVQECKDVATNQRLDVRRISPQCPEEGTHDFAEIYPGGMKEFRKPGNHMFTTTSWQDHLNAIRDGKRALLGVRLVKYGVYEAVRDDGSKLVFRRELPPQ